MHTTTLGDTGRRISRVGLGAMPLSLRDRPPREEALAVVRRAVELGITFLDTADVYCVDHTEIGHNEALVAEALREMGAGFGGGGGSPRVVVATKGGMVRPEGRWERDGRPEQILAACEASLRRLGAERIDLYQFHAPDPRVPFLESVGAFARLHQEGKVAAVGLSNVTVGEVEEARSLVPVASVQNRLSPWELGSGPVAIVEYCRREGITFLPYSPMGGSQQMQEVLASPALQKAAEAVGCAPAELILAFLLQLSPTLVPIPGASRISSVESSARAASLELSPESARRAEKALHALPGAAGPLRLAARRLRRLLPLLLLGGVGVAGCRTAEIRAPRPEVEPDIVQLPPPPPSSLEVPLTLDLAAIVEPLEGAIPLRFGSMIERHDHPSNSRMSFAFEVERSPFTIRVEGATATLSSTLRYRGRGWYDPPLAPEVSASCGTSDDRDDRPRAVLAISSPLTLTPEWGLESRARVTRVDRASDRPEDDCRVTVFAIDVTGRVIEAARGALERRTRAIDQAVAGVDLRSRIQRVWDIIGSPIELTDDVWLVIDPVAVTRGPLEGDGGMLVRTRLGLTATPRIVLGSRPDMEPRTLPDLEEGEVGDGLHILMEGHASYDAIGEFLTREIQGRELRWGGNSVRFGEIRVLGIGGGRLAVEVEFDGSARGRVFLVGTPSFDPDRYEIHVPDLDFDVESRNVLLSGAAWLARDNLVDFLRERARIPVRELMEMAEEQLHRGLNRDLSDEVAIIGEVLSTQAMGVVALQEILVVQSHAQARARVLIHAGEEEEGERPVAQDDQEE